MDGMKVKGLEYVFRKTLLIIKKKFENEMIGIDATGYHSHYYDKSVRNLE